MATRQEEIKAMTREQLTAFLTAGASHEPRWYPCWLGLARTGLRLGKALALEWIDLDFRARELRVARSLSNSGPGTPKSGHGRTVDMSKDLVTVLQRLATNRKAETHRRGWSALPPQVFCSEAGTPLQVANVRRAFARTLKRASTSSTHRLRPPRARRPPFSIFHNSAGCRLI